MYDRSCGVLLADDGKVVKAVSIIRDSGNTEEILLEELTVFQVRSTFHFMQPIVGTQHSWKWVTLSPECTKSVKFDAFYLFFLLFSLFLFHKTPSHGLFSCLPNEIIKWYLTSRVRYLTWSCAFCVYRKWLATLASFLCSDLFIFITHFI